MGIRMVTMAIVTREVQNKAAALALSGTLPDCLACGARAHTGPTLKGSWCWHHEKFARYWITGIPEYSIFVEGNQKLPFWAFSSLPAFTCPGAGVCLTWCYSYKAWRYPGAFYRQLQNAILLQSKAGRLHIATSKARHGFLTLPKGQTVRLYVDGDHDSIDTMRFWWALLAQRRDLPVYGYSKSWQLFLDYARTGEQWPTNYKLNLSSGSRYPEAIRQKVAALPITRGDFVAIHSDTKAPDRRKSPAAFAAFAKALKEHARAQGIAKSFVCPGKCGDCLPMGEHACGSDKFQDVTVIIGIH